MSNSNPLMLWQLPSPMDRFQSLLAMQNGGTVTCYNGSDISTASGSSHFFAYLASKLLANDHTASPTQQ